MVKLSYHYSTLDKTHEFGLETDDLGRTTAYINWFWFYLGNELAGLGINEKPWRVSLYPFAQGKVIAEYKFCNDARRQAIMVAGRIKKKLGL